MELYQIYSSESSEIPFDIMRYDLYYITIIYISKLRSVYRIPSPHVGLCIRVNTNMFIQYYIITAVFSNRDGLISKFIACPIHGCDTRTVVYNPNNGILGYRRRNKSRRWRVEDSPDSIVEFGMIGPKLISSIQ